MNTFQDIQTDRLVIRQLKLSDREALFAYRSLPEVWKYQIWRPANIGQVETFIRANMAVVPNTGNTWMQLAVCLLDGRMIGDIGVHFLEDDAQVEIGYTLNPSYQGEGYATEAVRSIVSYLFTSLNKHRITASIDPENTKSMVLLQRVGFRKEAHFIKSYRMGNEWFDDCIYAILEEEWIDQPKRNDDR